MTDESPLGDGGIGRAQRHSRVTERGRAVWSTERLWRLAAGLPPIRVAIDDIPEFDENCWFREPPSCREVARHARQILDANLAFPVILSSDGRLMDGGHRLAKAWLMGETEVSAQRFERDPDPDYIEPHGASLSPTARS